MLESGELSPDQIDEVRSLLRRQMEEMLRQEDEMKVLADLKRSDLEAAQTAKARAAEVAKDAEAKQRVTEEAEALMRTTSHPHLFVTHIPKTAGRSLENELPRYGIHVVSREVCHASMQLHRAREVAKQRSRRRSLPPESARRRLTADPLGHSGAPASRT